MANGNWGGAASQFSEVEVDAIQLAVANGIATYAAGEIEKLAGVPATLTDLLALAEATCYPRPFILAQSDGETPPLVFAATTFTAVSASDQGSNIMRLTSAFVHGLGAGSDGKYIWIQTTAGVPSGFYEITTRAVTTEIEVDVTAAYGSLIASTTIEYVGRTNQSAQAAVVTIPGGVMGPNGSLEVELWLRSSTSTANAKNYVVAYGTDADGDNGTECANGSLSSAYATQPPKPSSMRNVGAANSQRLFAFSTTHSAAIPTATIDTDQDFYVSIRLKNAVVDEDVMLSWRITLRPGV